MPTAPKISVYLEAGAKRIFACAIDWPGWSRSGRDEASALQALADYGKRYGSAIGSARLGFQPAHDAGSFEIVERIQGDMTTDFGTPGRIPAADERPVDQTELYRLQGIEKAGWRAFDRIAAAAAGRSLRLGARGGGRDRKKIIEHVVGAEHAYATALGVKLPFLSSTSTPEELEEFRRALLKGVESSAHGELPKQGPRGGRRWPARYFVRRSVWHLLDHAWEIEDRLQG